MLTRPIATVEPETITDRPACCIVSTIASSTRQAVGHLLAEAEDHQQRVVDRDPEPDERDEELDDDRDVGDVRQAEDAEERRQDRRRPRRAAASAPPAASRTRTAGSCSAPMRAEERLGEDARPAGLALRLEDRVDAR